MCNSCEAIERRLSKRAVYEEAVVVADECEGDDTDGLEDARVDQEGALKRAF